MIRRPALALIIWMLLVLTAQAMDSIRLAVTTSFENSGLADALLPTLIKDTRIDIQLIIVGTGQALALAKAGDVDAVLVHSPRAERDFIAAGYAPYRRKIMYNDFIIVGPPRDPANIAFATSAVDAFARIAADKGYLFASRGDDSGTHKAEQDLWQQAHIMPARDWYLELGAGMGRTLNTGVALGAYIFTDRGSWLNFQNKMDIKILFQGDTVLRNQYAFLPVSAKRHPHTRTQAVQQVENWFVSAKGQQLINAHRIEGQQVFFANAIMSAGGLFK